MTELIMNGIEYPDVLYLRTDISQVKLIYVWNPTKFAAKRSDHAYACLRILIPWVTGTDLRE